MNTERRREDIQLRVKEQLNKDKIKLWLQPYYDGTKEIGVGDEQEQAIQLLCVQLSQKLNISDEQCMYAVRDLQNHALDHLKSNAVFKETGVACLKVKVSGSSARTVTVNISLTAAAADLITEVSSATGIANDRLKLISHGRVLKAQESLVSQGVKNAMQLMAVVLAEDDKLQESEKRLKTLEATKNDVKFLAGRSNQNNEFYMQIENQSGEALNLPYHERKALVTAMALHEKGRAALKKEDYALALVLFLEADKEYSECTSQLLNASDNYALLHMDIAWCYLCLRNAAQIPDADRRLSLCEQNFHKSYGPNLERLIAINGSTGNEAALFMRLHLLQGVVRFYQNQRAEAKQLFQRAQEELNNLRVDNNKLCLLLELGFTNAEAHLGLRATHNNVEAAEELLHRRREEKKLARERNRLKLKNERERIQLGLCDNSKEFCEPSLVQQLEHMGFGRQQSITALKKSNNSISEAISLIHDQPHLLSNCTRHVSQESIAQVASLGVEPDVAREALEKCPDLEKAVKSLSSLATTGDAGSSAMAAATSSAMSLLQEVQKKRKATQEEEVKAFKRISEGLLEGDPADEYLGFNLAQEEQFLVEYMSLLD